MLEEKGERGGDELGDRVDIYTLLGVKWITDENLLYSTRNSSQCPVVT